MSNLNCSSNENLIEIISGASNNKNEAILPSPKEEQKKPTVSKRQAKALQKQQATVKKQLGKKVLKAKIKQEAAKEEKRLIEVTAVGKKRGRKAADPN